MAPRTGSRHSFALGVRDELAQLFLTEREPYRFRARHVAELQALAAMRGKTVALIDGEMTSWYGPRAIAGLGYLADFSSSL